MKINIYHIDTCLPDFFGGHHKAHLQVPLDCNTSIEDLRRNLLSELHQGAVGGSDTVADALCFGMIPQYMTAEEADEIGFLYTQNVDNRYVQILNTNHNMDVWKSYCDDVYEAAVKAAEDLTSRSEFPFQDLDPADWEEEEESVYAYFILEVE